jgi:hypothetical protein
MSAVARVKSQKDRFRSAIMNSNLNTLSEKIQTLSAEQITEVEDFVEFLRYRGQDRELARSAATLSSPALEAIWNNPEDDVYDAV